MRKHVSCLIVLLLFAAAAASAQESAGVKGGLNLGDLTFSGGTSNPNPSVRTGGIVGAFAEFPVSSAVAIQAELLFTMKGAKLSSTVSGFAEFEQEFKANYLDVPVLIRFNLSKTGTVVPFVYAGPNIGIRLSAKATTTVSGSTTDEDISNDLRSTDLGLTVGGGVRFGRLTAEVRFTQGLRNVLTDEASDNGALRVKTRGIAFLVGVKFK